MTDKSMREKTRERHPFPLSVRVTATMKAKLDQILEGRPRSVAMNDLILEALDLYLEQQEDVIGSRLHFNRTLQTRLNKLEAELNRLSMLMIFTMANGFATVMQGAVSGQRSAQTVHGGFYIKSGVESFIAEGSQLAEQLQNIQQSMDSNK